MNKPCKFYVTGNCKDGNKCKYKHIDNICKHHFFGICKKKDTCTKLHTYKLNENLKKKKNTENFLPSHQLPDMRVIIGDSSKQNYEKKITSLDVILVDGLFKDIDNIYDNLLLEINNCNIEQDKLWKLWHGDTHYIADDHLKWKDNCPTFCSIINKIKTYFNMEIKATRFNLFKNSDDWKPYHHDAAAVDLKKAKTQNFTVGVSFGCERDISFQHDKSKNTINFPLTNGCLYSFSKQINIDWKHGVPQINPELKHCNGRISIIAWGQVSMTD